MAKPISTDMEIDVQKIFVESNRESGLYDEVNVSQEIVQGYVNKFGSYKFSLRDPSSLSASDATKEALAEYREARRLDGNNVTAHLGIAANLTGSPSADDELLTP